MRDFSLHWCNLYFHNWPNHNHYTLVSWSLKKCKLTSLTSPLRMQLAVLHHTKYAVRLRNNQNYTCYVKIIIIDGRSLLWWITFCLYHLFPLWGTFTRGGHCRNASTYNLSAFFIHDTCLFNSSSFSNMLVQCVLPYMLEDWLTQ